MLLTILITIAVFVVVMFLFMQQSKFGKTPRGERLEFIKKSPYYNEKKFSNINHTPELTEGVSYATIMKEFFFVKNPNVKPPKKLPSQKINLHHLNINENVLVWFGHSSYFIQVDGKRILVDPVLSGAASPIRFTTKSFDGSDAYSTDDIPEIDYLFLTHDHWDHLDHDTMMKLKPKLKKIITSLGVGEHLEHWGFTKNSFIETQWNDETILDQGFKVITITARHFSGRGLKRAQALWSSFVFITPTQKIFLGGDSGYDTHFEAIGNQHGPFDLVILECGQYNNYWKYIHSMPEETAQIAVELKAKKLLPVHWAKFALSMHDWDEPIKRVSIAAAKKNMPLLTPMIGEAVYWQDDTAQQNAWWENLK
jgi:L-ascorbate metabolism protein UlaG (beta-lactamase superfamily)